MPSLLGPKEKQFSTNDANYSRLITMIRYIVEQVNGRIKKKFKFFRNQISNNHLDNLQEYFRIACALSNAFFCPLITDTEELKEKVELAIKRSHIPNDLQNYILENKLDRKSVPWINGDRNSVPDFPILSDVDLKIITVGTFQLKNAADYTFYQLKQDPNFQIKIFKSEKNIIQVKIQSKYVKRKLHQCFVEFDPKKSGHNSIAGYYCKCNVGARTIGCCSHVATVLWFFGRARHNPTLIPKKTEFSNRIINAHETHLQVASGNNEVVNSVETSDSDVDNDLEESIYCEDENME